MLGKYRVKLDASQRISLKRLTSEGTSPARMLAHARVLMLVDESKEKKGWPDQQVADALGVSKNTVRRVRRLFVTKGQTAALERPLSVRSLRSKLRDPAYSKAIFAILHSPPSDFGFNRTSWRRIDLRLALNRRGVQIGKNYVDRIIRNAGYRCRKVKEVLTSDDPEYREKVDRILRILNHLSKTERFFSIDEFGPVAIKQRGGRRVMAPGEHPTVPQIQRSKGSLVLTAALELSTNQVTHFYSSGKNSQEMIRLLNLLVAKYRSCTKLYLSWDAAGWHASKTFMDRLREINSRAHRRANDTPLVRLAPLPSRAQFLNVIESVFSGLAVSVIHHSNYRSVDEAKASVDRYFAERNEHFWKFPKKAGNMIWRRERVSNTFSEGQNCKNPRFR